MSIDKLISLIDQGREIEFEFLGTKYSITYGSNNHSDIISFCEFYKEPIDVDNVEDLLNIKVGSLSLRTIIDLIPEQNFEIF